MHGLALLSIAERGTGARRTRVSGNGGPLHLGRRESTRADRAERRHRDPRDAGRQRQSARARARPRRTSRRSTGIASTRSPDRSRSRVRGPATPSPWRSSSCASRSGAGRRSSRASASCPTISRHVPAHLRPHETASTPSSAKTSRSRLSRSSGRWASVRAARSNKAGDAAGDVRRQPGHAPARAGLHALPARQVEGALFSCGDAHAAQGDGEVCVTGIETPIGATLRFTLERGRRLPGAAVPDSGPADPRANRGDWYGTTGVGPDLYVAAQDAVRAMIDHVSATTGSRPRTRTCSRACAST